LRTGERLNGSFPSALGGKILFVSYTSVTWSGAQEVICQNVDLRPGDVRDGHCLPGLGRVSLQGWKALESRSVAFHQSISARILLHGFCKPFIDRKHHLWMLLQGRLVTITAKKSREHESRNNQSREDFNLWLV
jgi:hypothetical protein